MSALTCITCRVAFATWDLQRSHYKTDWHRYNLKRKVAEMPAVTAENFQQRVLAQQSQDAEADKDKSSYCTLCGKNFSTQNSYENHLKSKKHKDAEAAQAEKLLTEVEERNARNTEKGISVLSENEKVSIKNAKNQALKESLVATGDGSDVAMDTGGTGQSGAKPKASRKASSQPGAGEGQMEMDGDSDGSYEEWEGEALGEEQCLFCSHVSKDIDTNVAHMTRVHGFYIPDIEYLVDLSGLINYLGEKVGEGHMCLWCNDKGRMFLTTLAAQRHMVDKGHCKMRHEGDAVFEFADFYDYRSSYPDNDDQLSTEASGGAGASTDVDMDEDAEVSLDELHEQNYQLVLPSGSTVGHRSLQRYYRQKLKPTRVINPNAVSRVIAQYKALGWTGCTGPDTLKRAKDVAFVQRIKHKQHMTLGVRANKMQHHYRSQTGY